MPLGRLPLFSICQEMPCGSIEDGDDRDSHGRAFGHVMSTLFHRQSTSKGHRTFDRKAWMEGLERQGKTWLLKCITGFVGVQVSECSSTAKWDGVNDPESSQPPDLPVWRGSRLYSSREQTRMGNIAMYGDFHPTEYHVGAVRKCKSEILDNENWADRWPSDLLQEGSGCELLFPFWVIRDLSKQGVMIDSSNTSGRNKRSRRLPN